jgi:hypothetical protein
MTRKISLMAKATGFNPPDGKAACQLRDCFKNQFCSFASRLLMSAIMAA